MRLAQLASPRVHRTAFRAASDAPANSFEGWTLSRLWHFFRLPSLRHIDDPLTFLGLFQSSTGQQNYSDYANPAYDALLARADQEPDAGRRADLLAEAEQLVLDDASVAPVDFTVNRNLVSPRITGWTDNLAATRGSSSSL